MKLFKSTLSSALLVFSANSNAINFWHSGTTWAGQGMCAAELTFDSGLEDIRDLHVTIDVLNNDRTHLDTVNINISEFGQYSAIRYKSAYIESEVICEQDLILSVIAAKAMINGKSTDLLGSHQIAASAFQPMAIELEQ